MLVLVLAEDLVLLMEGTHVELQQIAGMSIDLWTRQWQLTQDLGINYIACFQKNPVLPEDAAQP